MNAAEPSTVAEFEEALKVLDLRLGGAIRNASVFPHWINGGAKFWFERSVGQTSEYDLVDCVSGEVAPLFNHEAVRIAVNAVAGQDAEFSPAGIRVAGFDPSNESLELLLAGNKYRCGTEGQDCEHVPPLAMGLRAGELPCPSGEQALFAKDNNLCVRKLATNEERQITNDGAEYYSWGKVPDSGLLSIKIRSGLLSPGPFGAAWSPDGTTILAARMDEREVAVFPIVDWAPSDGEVRPKLHSLRVPILGDQETPELEYSWFSLGSGEQTQLDPGDGYVFAPGGIVGWSEDRQRAYMIANSDGHLAQRLVEVSAQGSRVVIEEEAKEDWVRAGPALYNGPNIRLVNSGADCIWYSERTGWGHLYRYNLASGEEICALTSGKWAVFDIVAIDDERGQVYFTAGGREDGRDPYFPHLYRVSLSGNDVELLTPENAAHHFDGAPSPLYQSILGMADRPVLISPDKRFAIDTYSSVEQPPETVLRDLRRPQSPVRLQSADVQQVHDEDIPTAKRFKALAADGVTEIYGSIYEPPGLDPTRKYPLVNALYAGPQVVSSPVRYTENFTSMGNGDRAALAKLGCIVMVVDGRGTPYRSREFQRASRGANHGVVTLSDHRAAIEQLATERPYIDLDRVGVYGHSWGGYHAAYAIMLHNDLYKVAVASAGIFGYEWCYPGSEVFVGLPDFGGGRRNRASPDEVPENIASVGIAKMADRLKGKLLIAYGDVDENVPPNQASQLIRALVDADKDFDLIQLPGRDHAFWLDPYFARRRLAYLASNLGALVC